MQDPNILSALDKTIAELKQKKQFSKDANGVTAAIQKELVAAMQPVLAQMAQGIANEVKNAVKGLQIPAPSVTMPAVNVPKFEMPPFPDIPAPVVHVRVPDMKMPDINFPEFPTQMLVNGDIGLRDFNQKNPLPVMVYGADGKPMLFPMGGGGKSNAFVIKDILTAFGNSVMDTTNNAVKTHLVASDVAINAAQASGAADSVNVIQFGGTAVNLDQGYSYPGTLRVVHATDVAVSVNVSGFVASVGVDILNGDGNSLDPRDRNWTVTETLTQKQLSGTIDSVEIASQQISLGVFQASGFNFSVEIASQPFTLDTKQVSGGMHSVEIASQPFTLDVRQVSGTVDSISIASQPFTLDTKQVSGGNHSIEIASQPFSLDVKQVSGSIDSVAIASQPFSFDIKQVSGSSDSVQASGDVAAGVADSGNPVKMGGVAMTTNPTAVTDGQRANIRTDKIGRPVMTPIQVRDLRATAYATLSTNTETTLLAGIASTFLDLVYIAFANTSSGAIAIDLRDATTGGIVATFNCPAEATQGIALSMPIPQNVAADTWTVDFNDADISNTTVFVNALFAKNT